MPASLPLTGIRILAIEQLMALPFCTQLLADFGADVISVESIGYGSYAASRWRERTGRHKRRVQIRLNDSRGQQLIRRMAQSVDVVAENFRPGVMDRYGLGYSAMRELSERLIYVSVSGFGHRDVLESPLSPLAAYGPIGEAMSGTTYAIRQQGGISSGVSLGDIVSSMVTTSGILIALRHRDSTGLGQYVDVSMADSLMALAELPFLRHSLAQLEPTEATAAPGRRSGVDYPDGVFGVKDGELQVLIMNDVHWHALCTVLQHEEWIDDPGLNDPATRPGLIKTAVLPVVQKWAAQRSKAEAADTLRAAGIAAAPINSPADVDRHPHFTARRMIETVETASGEPLRVAGNPIKLSAVEAARDPAAPMPRISRPGEHTRIVLQDVFGLSDEEYRDLENDGVVEDHSVVQNQ